MKKKLLSVLLVAAMTLSLVACGGSSDADAGADTNAATEEDATANAEDTQEAESEATGEATTIALDGSWPEETIKIGVVGYDSTNEQQISVQEYYEYLAEYYNIEIMFSEDLADAEGELNFISDCAAAGCKAIVAYYNEALEQSALTAADYGMYYWGGFGGDEEAYNAVKDNEYYLGGYTLGQAEYEAGRSMALALAEQGCEKVVLCSGGASMGVPMFVERKQGFLDGVEEANANGANMEIVYEVEGWPGTDAFTAAQTSVMGMDIDAIASTFEIAMWFQLVMESGKADSISLACVGSVSDTYKTFVDSGLITCVVYDNTEVVFGNAIPMILNAVGGNKLVNEDGSAILVPVERWTITSAEQFNTIYDVHSAGNYIIDAEDIANLIVESNPEMTAKDFMDYYGSFTIDSVGQ